MSKFRFYWMLMSIPLVLSLSNDLVLPKIDLLSFNEGRSIGLGGGDRPAVNLTFRNDSVYQIPSGIGEIVVECSAPYPISWNLADSDLDPETFPYVRVRSRRTFIDVFDPSTFNYTSQLALVAISNAHKLTGNYTCQSTANEMVSSSIYVFWEGTASLVHSKENLIVYWKDDQAGLPCQITSPTKQRPRLLKLGGNGKGIPSEIPFNRSVSYSPLEGYTLKKLPFPLGVYRCEYSSDDYVTLTVKLLNETAVSLKKLMSNATFTFDKETNQVKCCSSSKRSPKIFIFHCDHASTCMFREHAIQPYHFILMRNKKDGNCASRILAYYHTALIRCMGDGIDQYKEVIAPMGQYYSPWRKRKTIVKNFFRWEEIEPQDMLVVAVDSNHHSYHSYGRVNKNKPNSPLYAYQSVSADCQTSPYYFSEGSHWTILWKNKTLSHPKVNALASTDHYYGGASESLSLKIDLSMEALVCFAPVWNSSLWVTKTYFLHVNETKMPSFKNPQSQEFSWYTNETGKELSCEATGTPNPDIIWQHGQQLIGASYIHNYNVTNSINNETKVVKSILRISTVSYSTHGAFSCKASNYGGEVVRLFTVTVVEQPAWKTTVILIIAAIVICVLFGILGVFLRRMHLDKKAIDQLASVHFKDPATRENVVGTDVVNTTYDNGKITNQLIS